jgi:hypothetical protein
MAREKKEEGGMVGFRLSARHLEKLTVRANRAGTSHHRQAQAIVEAALDEREEETMLMRVELADLRAEVEAIRAGLVKILTGLLASSRDERMPLDAARSFVKEAFARKGAVKK